MISAKPLDIACVVINDKANDKEENIIQNWNKWS